jgi:hypothetical protein
VSDGVHVGAHVHRHLDLLQVHADAVGRAHVAREHLLGRARGEVHTDSVGRLKSGNEWRAFGDLVRQLDHDALGDSG